MKIFIRSFFVGLLLLSALLPAPPAVAQSLLLNVVDARLLVDQRTGQPILVIRAADSETMLQRFTEDNVGRTMQVRIDGETVMSAVLRTSLSGNTMQIAGLSEHKIRAAIEYLSKDAARIELVILP